MLSNIKVDRNVVAYFYTLIGDLKKLRATADKPYKIGIFTFLWIIFNHYYRIAFPYGKRGVVDFPCEHQALKAFYKKYKTCLNAILKEMQNDVRLSSIVIRREPFAGVNAANIPQGNNYIKDFLVSNKSPAKRLLNDLDNDDFALKYHNLGQFRDVYDYLCLIYLMRNFIIHGNLFLKNDEFDELLNFSVETFTVFMEHLTRS